MIKMKKILGTVPFINCHPLNYAIDSSSLKLLYSVPSNLLNLLKKEKVNLSLLPIADHIENSSIYSLENKCISSIGKVDSVILISNTELKNIENLYLDTRSKSSNLLTRIIFNEFLDLAPNLKTFSPSKNIKIENNSGYVVIGDLGLEITYASPIGLKIYDLGEIWFNETNLPFTFASYNYIEKPNSILIKNLENSYNDGVKNINHIVENIYENKLINLEKKIIEKYLSERIVYEFSKKHKEGIDLYMKLARNIIEIERNVFNG
tara:strand:+ start:1229 stop:2020 length:792 start_codon:yes stop_codon:yes gene_type:complete